MRKFSVRFAILCILVLLVGVTALAVSGTVSNLKNQDANVTVTQNPGNAGESPSFTITRTNAMKDKLYTVLIRSGAENDKPSGGQNGNLVYMDIVKAEQDGELKVTKAYPMDMSAGTYRVFMSEYGNTNAIQQVATFEVEGTNPDNVKLGFVVDQNADDITANDALAALYISVGKPQSTGQAWTKTQQAAANVDGDTDVTANDALWILERSVGKRDANWQKVG